MSKSSVLGVVALLIASGALGLGIYQIVFVPTPADSGVRNTWYDFHYSSVYTNPADTLILVDQLLINFTVNPGESAFFLFSTYATVQAGAPSYIQFNFALDGVQLAGPTYPWWTLLTNGARIDAPVSFHLALEAISAGAHNASIVIFGNDATNEIFSSTLLVQTYI